MKNLKTHFCIAKPEYRLSYDKSLLNGFNFKNFRIIFKYFLCFSPNSKDEGLYYRILESSQGKCIQCIFFYKTQYIPYHPHDYHPFYIYLDDNNCVRYVIIDGGHHFSKLISVDAKAQKKLLIIALFLPDHGLTNQINHLGKNFEPTLIPLLPEQIVKWWQINNMAQIKLRTKLVDPWAPGLIPNIPSQNKSLIYRLNYILPFKICPSEEKNLRFSFRDEAFCPTCQRFTSLDFMPLFYNESLDRYCLRKEMTCPNNHRYIIQYNFETAQIEYEKA
jgi:hypothetical protein